MFMILFLWNFCRTISGADNENPAKLPSSFIGKIMLLLPIKSHFFMGLK